MNHATPYFKKSYLENGLSDRDVPVVKNDREEEIFLMDISKTKSETKKFSVREATLKERIF